MHSAQVSYVLAYRCACPMRVYILTLEQVLLVLAL
jgi:hypothetical protein